MKLVWVVVAAIMFAACVEPAVNEARVKEIASAALNDELKDKTFDDSGGNKRPYPRVQPGDWEDVAAREAGWVLRIEPPAGMYAEVEVSRDGKRATVTRYGFAAE